MPIFITLGGITFAISAKVATIAVGAAVTGATQLLKTIKERKSTFHSHPQPILSPPYNLLVLGDESVGKTTLIRALQGKHTADDKILYQTHSIPFEFQRTYNTMQRTIKGVDFGGSRGLVGVNYSEKLQQCDCLLYLCNLSQYLSDNDRCEDNNTRLWLIKTELSKRSKEIPVQLILTHIGELRNPQKEYQQFISILQNKEYGDLFLKKQPILVEMKNTDELKSVLGKIDKLIFK